MSNITFEEVYALAVQLPREEQARLAAKLQLQKPFLFGGTLTREGLITEFERRKSARLFEGEIILPSI